jgi:hypothetical protein
MTFFTRLLFTLLGLAFALLFTVGVLCWLVLYVAFAAVRWLLTGQKPQVLLMWQQIQAFRKSMQSGQGPRWSGGSGTSEGPWPEEPAHAKRTSANSEVIEDVVVREIQDKRHLPKD